jgi:ATP-binding cassette subfamily F protein 1
MNVTPVEHLRNRFQDEGYQSIRNRLGKYGLEGHAHEVVMRDLSGGQKARVVFVELSLQRPHILLLGAYQEAVHNWLFTCVLLLTPFCPADEPTNNLDIETIDALVDAINQFNGGIVVVTHDQRLIEYCECTLWVVEKRGVTKWEAGFDDYKQTLLKEMEEQIEKEAAERQKKLDAAAAARTEKMARLAKKVKK